LPTDVIHTAGTAEGDGSVSAPSGEEIR